MTDLPVAGTAPGAPAPASDSASDSAPESGPDLARRALEFTRRRFLLLLAAIAPGVLTAGLRWPRDDAAVIRGVTPGSPATPAPGNSAAPVPAGPPRWAFGVDATKCIGCGTCVGACKAENGVPLAPEYNRTWIERHSIAPDGTVFVDSPEGGAHGFPAKSTAPGAENVEFVSSAFVPRLCMQCENPPCVTVCPVGATYRTPEGIVLVDQARCIGCGYCVVACPYGARYLVPEGDRSPTGQVGVADKCTWCYHRITDGRQPACVEVCPVDARVFGDLNDEASPIQAFLQAPGSGVLRPELGTLPRVFYVGIDSEVG